ncbi:MAG: methyltransferase domain-containing protein [Rhodospirillaceae bacterium]|nr:methyltransferase domain-containing protein [Rhodospirillaceae bacterium]
MTKPLFSGKGIPCPLCSGDDHTVVGITDRHGKALRTVLCRDCGHVFTNPQPTAQEISAFYEHRYRTAYKGTATPKPKHVYRAGLRALERFDQLKSFCAQGVRVLDVGSGGGEFAYLMRKLGFHMLGIEPNQGYAEFSRNEYDLDVNVGGVENIPETNQAYDVITLYHVLEHLESPVAVLAQLRDSLNDDGLLIVEVPNVEARYHGPNRQFHLAHLHSFSLESLQLAGNRAGLTATSVTLQPHTKHISIIFKKASETYNEAREQGIPKRIEDRLRRHTQMSDIFSARPYRRLWANFKRPIRERLALARLGNPPDTRTILDRLYSDLCDRQAV